jgi:hypothetical protein
VWHLTQEAKKFLKHVIICLLLHDVEQILEGRDVAKEPCVLIGDTELSLLQLANSACLSVPKFNPQINRCIWVEYVAGMHIVHVNKMNFHSFFNLFKFLL